MGHTYDQAVSALYQAAFESFVTERKRLAGELKAEGDKSGAAQLAKLGRPSISAWAVNQLWWHARSAFDELFDAAAELRKGKLSASPAHRKALAMLTARAEELLRDAGHSANDATLRRVTMTLSGLAAAGGFEPDQPGALTKDREPPGFEAFVISSSSDADRNDEVAIAESKREAEGTAAERKRDAEAAAAQRQRDAEAAAAARKRQAEAEAKRQARQRRLESELADAKKQLTEREHERDRIAKQLATAEREVERARAGVEAARAELDAARAP